VLDRLRAIDRDTAGILGVLAVALVIAIPLVVSGPGNDLDVGNVFRSGRAIARHLDYVPSRPPGAPVHEALVGFGDLLGGPLLTNLLSLAAAGLLLWQLDRLLRDEGIAPSGRWVIALIAVNPWFLIAATSTADYVFALLFLVLAARALRHDHAVLAGIAGAAAMGCRVGSITLLVALAVAEACAGRTHWRRVLLAGGTAAALTLVVFIPSFVEAGGLTFAQNDFSASSPLVQAGRAAAKDVLVLGIPTTLLVLAAIPALFAATRQWSTTWLVRFGLVGLVLSQLLFLRFPWKMAHLLPTLLCIAILLAVALEDRRRWLMAMVALQLVFGFVRVDVIAPNDANQASGGKIAPTVTAGPVLTDWRCRRDDPDAYLGRQKEEIEAAWDCAAPYQD
jgi:hypothetical protein